MDELVGYVQYIDWLRSRHRELPVPGRLPVSLPCGRLDGVNGKNEHLSREGGDKRIALTAAGEDANDEG